ncbi:MAG: DUF1648 domain-containing protein [bacterium]|nr:DUF1648 domain-containing protein [bacterium]
MKRSWLTLILAPAFLLALIVTPFGLYWSELPDPMAIHWGLAGDPNGSAPPLLALVGIAGIFVAMIVAVRRVLARTPYEAPSFVAGLFGVGVLLAGISWLSVVANRDVTSWTAADEVGFVHLLVLFAVAVGIGCLGWVLAGGTSGRSSGDRGVVPSLEVSDPDHAVWSGRGVGRLTVLIGVGVIVAGLVIWGWSGVLLVAIGLVALMFAVVRVTVGQHGAVISLGWWGYPSWTVPMDSISAAEVETVNPMAYGGWGYRVRPGVRAIVVRSGGSLRLVRDDAADLVYTVDDAETGAGLVNAILGASKR